MLKTYLWTTCTDSLDSTDSLVHVWFVYESYFFTKLLCHLNPLLLLTAATNYYFHYQLIYPLIFELLNYSISKM